jgi:hypothetical protein
MLSILLATTKTFLTFYAQDGDGNHVDMMGMARSPLRLHLRLRPSNPFHDPHKAPCNFTKDRMCKSQVSELISKIWS